MIVPVPPTLAAYAMLSIIIISRFPDPLSISRRTACRIGIIMTVVAVLEIHMDKKAVGIMNPSIKRRGEVPILRRIFKAILLKNDIA